MAGWHHPCNGRELGQTLGDDEGQGGLACCNPWGHRVRHHQVTEKQDILKSKFMILNYNKTFIIEMKTEIYQAKVEKSYYYPFLPHNSASQKESQIIVQYLSHVHLT